MNNNINKILEDLYGIDPDLAKHEEELRKIIEKLLATRPNVQMDDEFVAALRREVMAKAEALSLQDGKPASMLAQFMNINKFAFAVAGAVITLIIVIPVMNYLNHPASTANLAAVTDSLSGQSKEKIARLSADAFGPLMPPGTDATPAPADDSAALTQGNAVAAPEMAFGLGGGGGSAVPGKAIMPPYEWVNYEYSYVGDDLTAPEGTLPVYRRNVSQSTAANLGSLVGGADLPAVNFSQFSNLQLSNMTVNEDRDNGYSLYFNFLDGMVNIDMEWDRWPQPMRECKDQACYDSYRLQPSDVPADSELVAIAGSFLDSYGIDMSNYGAGQVRSDWRVMYDMAADKSAAYIPDMVTVVYPLIIEGQTAYDESGYANGMNVNINIRDKKVANVNGLKTLGFDRSDYIMETDMGRIRKLAENGGNPWPLGSSEGAKTVTVKLGTPAQELVWYWRYNSSNGRGEEMYVPALVFPILNKADVPNLYRDNIVVFLAKEILDERGGEGAAGMPEPMPLIMREGAAVSAPATGTVDGGAVMPSIPLGVSDDNSINATE